VDRWKRASAVFWRAEPAPALVLYFLLMTATALYMHLAGGHIASSLGSLHSIIARDVSAGGLAVYAFFVWRMWLGGGMFWSLSLGWQLLLLVVMVNACYRTPNLAVFGLLALALAGLVPLFAAAVLDRVSPPAKRATPRAAGRALVN
jgi:hypothetical protein